MDAAGDEEVGGQGGSNAAVTAADVAVPVQRHGSKAQQSHVLDELAQETKRVNVLERLEVQLKGKNHCSRLLFAFSIGDDRKVQNTIDQEFLSWRKRQEQGSEITGVMLYLGPSAVSFLEGPTEMLFKAMDLFHGLSQEVTPQPVMPLPPADMRTNTSARTETEPAQQPRSAVIGAVRVLYFTELHGVRTSTGWCSCASQAKLQGGASQPNLEEGPHEHVFTLYSKLLQLCLKVQNAANDEKDPDRLQGYYKRFSDFLPTPEEANLLLGKQGNDHFFSFAEFQDVFVKPFRLVLNSELLWPMPPALSY